MCVLLITLLLKLVRAGWDPINPFNHTSLVAVITPNDSPKSVHKSCVIKILVVFFCRHIAVWIYLGSRICPISEKAVSLSGFESRSSLA